ncbi:class I SAM-dependent methyltransferase [Candidatus Parcubacteria bacterium]|nr:class I SAM-dependent methyltransferase [Candidatus Parcubacteria bacterium]
MDKVDTKKLNIEKYKIAKEGEKYKSQPTKIMKTYLFRKRCKVLFGRDEKVLDIGGGAGNWTNILREENITTNIYALDISRAVLDERNKEDVCTEGDMEKLPFDNDYFDCSMFFASLHHVYNTELAMSEASRVTKSNGSIVFYEPISIRLLLQNKSIKPTPDGIEFSFSFLHILRTLKKNNLKITKIYYEGFFSRYFKKVNFAIYKPICLLEEGINYIPVIKHLFGIFGDYVIIKAKKNESKRV